MLVLAFDFGLKHIGVATGQSITRTATPLTTLRARDGVPDFAEIGALIDDWKPVALLVGLPLNMDQTESDMSRRARKFAARLGGRFGLPTLLVDERLTSREAHTRLGSAPSDPRTHAAAAAVIAETWLLENEVPNPTCGRHRDRQP